MNITNGLAIDTIEEKPPGIITGRNKNGSNTSKSNAIAKGKEGQAMNEYLSKVPIKIASVRPKTQQMAQVT